MRYYSSFQDFIDNTTPCTNFQFKLLDRGTNIVGTRYPRTRGYLGKPVEIIAADRKCDTHCVQVASLTEEHLVAMNNNGNQTNEP